MKPEVGGIYYHFKKPDHHYVIVGIAMHTETQEDMVIYQEQEGEKRIFARPINMFFEEVEKPEFNYKGPRFIQVK